MDLLEALISDFERAKNKKENLEKASPGLQGAAT